MIFLTKKIAKKVLAILVIAALCTSSIYALETNTHEGLNEYIARNTLNSFLLDSYLNNQLGMQIGVEEIVNSQKVWQWFRDGGLKEDIPYVYMPYLRSVNHFHNPLTEQGFSGIWGTGFLYGQSSIQWSQSSIRTQYPGGYYSWYDVRDFFYKALTKQNKTSRDNYFAEMFRGIGQLMHLVEDLSVPEHTRDDGHYIFYNYEKWVKDTGNDRRKNVDIDPLAGIISIRNSDLQNFTIITPVFYDPSTLGNPNPIAPLPFANLFDTRQYIGTNPDVTLQSNIGLSEYTNANFLSPASMFTTEFSYPAWSSVVEYEEVIDATTGKKKTYLKKISDGETINHLAAGRWFYKYLPSNLKSIGLTFDDRVYSDYAQKLIPRAVGYSAGLLNYFFRGSIDMIPDDIIGSGAIIVNKTEEDLTGTFEIYYDDINSNRQKLWGGTFALGPLSSGNNVSSNIVLTQPENAKEECVYILVFRGTLGGEQNAVIGKILR